MLKEKVTISKDDAMSKIITKIDWIMSVIKTGKRSNMDTRSY